MKHKSACGVNGGELLEWLVWNLWQEPGLTWLQPHWHWHIGSISKGVSWSRGDDTQNSFMEDLALPKWSLLFVFQLTLTLDCGCQWDHPPLVKPEAHKPTSKLKLVCAHCFFPSLKTPWKIIPIFQTVSSWHHYSSNIATSSQETFKKKD